MANHKKEPILRLQNFESFAPSLIRYREVDIPALVQPIISIIFLFKPRVVELDLSTLLTHLRPLQQFNRDLSSPALGLDLFNLYFEPRQNSYHAIYQHHRHCTGLPVVEKE
jgi:hypothetical protein